MNKQRGFTLIELLVVIAIIGLLSSIVMASLNSAREKARDTSRKQSLIQLRNALEMYYADNGSFPTTDSNWYGSDPSSTFETNDGEYIPNLAPTYISSLPQDPKGGWSKLDLCTDYGAEPTTFKSEYLYRSNGVGYKLISHCAPEGTISINDSFNDTQRSGYAWQVCSDETACAW